MRNEHIKIDDDYMLNVAKKTIRFKMVCVQFGFIKLL